VGAVDPAEAPRADEGLQLVAAEEHGARREGGLEAAAGHADEPSAIDAPQAGQVSWSLNVHRSPATVIDRASTGQLRARRAAGSPVNELRLSLARAPVTPVTTAARAHNAP